MKTNLKLLTATFLLCIITAGRIKAQNVKWPTSGNMVVEHSPVWLTSGNNATSPNIHFLGTIDNQALVFRTNNTARMWITNTGNVGIGTSSPSAKLQVTGGDAIINGITVGRGKGAGVANTAVGDQALFSNTTGFGNTALGDYVLYHNTSGRQNTGNGTYSLFYNTTGVANTANGMESLVSNTTGNHNTATGYNALSRNTTGNYNIANGTYTLNANTTGNYNTAIGYFSFPTGAAFSNSTAIGANAAITASNQVRLGDNNVTSLYSMGAYSSTTAISPNMYVSATGQIMRSTTGVGGDWGLSGNAGTIDGTNFIGTTDNVPFSIRVNNQRAGRIEIHTNRANTFYGYRAGNSNSSGRFNTANGFQSFFLNISGEGNTANGHQALHSNTTGHYNTATGHDALRQNIYGAINTATGTRALVNNTSGSANTANGAGALSSNTTGEENTASGFNALSRIITGGFNTGVGVGAGGFFNSNRSTFLGSSASATADFRNGTAIGFDARVNNNNKVRIGDLNVTVVESAAGSWTVSDGRFKTNITEEVKGLEFIKLLRPVVYNFDANNFDAFLSQAYPDSIKAIRKEMMNKSSSKISGIRQTGLIAQEVEIAAKKSGYNFNGVHAPENPTDNYSISYEKLVVPLVKAVQELSSKNDALQLENEALKTRLDKIEQRLTANSKTFENISSARLEQNAPNPYKGNTIINYYVPFNAGNAVIKITDMKGSLLKTFNVKEGKGQVALQSDMLAAGTYQYSLFVNGRLIDTKQMVLIR